MKTVHPFPVFNHNIRLSTVPGLLQEEYDLLVQGKDAKVEDDTAAYLIQFGYAEDVEPGKKKGK